MTDAGFAGAGFAGAEAFVRANTAVAAPPLCPEIALHLATRITPIWEATEAELKRAGVPPPFWAFCWAGGQALARYVLDHPHLVAGKRVLDFASGCGVVAIAAARAGAAQVVANDIDPFAEAAVRINATLNGVSVQSLTEDLVGRVPGSRSAAWDVVLTGDICYERALADRVAAWLRALAGAGATVLMGDPGRSYLPVAGLVELARYAVPTSRELEDRDMREGIVWRVTPGLPE